MKVIKAPEDIFIKGIGKKYVNTVFLGGSIEMGKAEDWQSKIQNECKDTDIVFYNPRRDDWDSSWEQKIENDKFREQVEWELSAQDDAELIVYYFSPETKAPITLLELGLFKDRDVIVCCPEGFWRKGNVDIVCKWFNVTQVNSIEELIEEIKKRFS